MFLRLPAVEYIPSLEALRGPSGVLHNHVMDKWSHLSLKHVVVAVSGHEEDELGVAVRVVHNELGKYKLHRRVAVGDSAGVGFEASCRTL